MKSERKRRVYYDPCQEKVYEKKGKAYCEHYPEGLPVCGKCREESALAHDKACALLAEARTEIERKDNLVEQMREALHLADDLIDEYAADYEHRDNVDEIRDGIKVALAAERGE